MNSRLAGIVSATALAVILALALLIALSIAGVREKNLVAIATSLGIPTAGLLLVAWKKPEMFVGPISSAWTWLSTRLSRPVQRALFLLSLAASLPWLAVRAVGEAFESATITDYIRSAYYPLANSVLQFSSWRYEPTWCEWLMLAAIATACLALFWESLVAPVNKWVRGGGAK